jgi:hypothetical protein
MTAPDPTTHIWKFVRTGGLDQVTLESASDLRALAELDQKLWVALSCPVKGLQLDERTLALVDTDGDGHVRPPEVIAAVSWACARLKDPAAIFPGADALPASALSASPEGAAVAETLRWIAAKLGKEGPVTGREAADVAAGLSKGPLKGDGVLRPEAGPDDATRDLIRDITATCGETTAKTVAAFYADLEAFKAWSSAGGATAEAGLGPSAAEAFAAVDAVRKKVADYFTRARLAAFDPAAVAGLNRQVEDYRAISGGELAVDAPVLLAMPLAHIEAGRPLPLLAGVNPAWAEALARLQNAAVVPLLGAGTVALTEADWAALAEKLRPYEAWVGTRPASPVAKLGIDRINAILAGAGRQALADLLAEDALLAPRVAAAADVERLALFYRDLGTLLRNFVNFHDFYSKTKAAVFQAGTLYLDSRSPRLCIQVEDVDAHAVFAAMSKIYVAYLTCRRSGGQTMKIAAAITQGDSDYLFVGRNGVFYDRAGRDWDATVVKITESPISIRQAFFTPYKKVAAFVSEQFTKFISTKEAAAQGALTSAVAAPPAATPPAPAFDIAKFAGIFAALGLAVGAIGGALATVSRGFLRLPVAEWPLAVGVALLVISGPSMILAALKLKQRNLGPLLEGNGWAVNSRVKINMPLGSALTDRRVLPPNSTHLTLDPYEDDAANERRTLIVVAVVVIIAGLIAAKAYRFWPFA